MHVLQHLQPYKALSFLGQAYKVYKATASPAKDASDVAGWGHQV